MAQTLRRVGGCRSYCTLFLDATPCWWNLDLKIHACACPERVALGLGVRRKRPFLGLQAFPAEAWSTRAAVNQSFSEALRGDERKSSAPAFATRICCCPRWLPSRGLFSRILPARSWFAPAGRSALAANGRFAAQRLDPEGNGLQLLERHLLQRAGGRCAVNRVDHDGLGV